MINLMKKNLNDLLSESNNNQFNIEDYFKNNKDETDHNQFIKFIHEISPKIKPKFLKISNEKWKILIRGVLRGENILITGHRGEGKTVLAIALSHVLNRPLFKFNFGHMQDAQTALIGKTHLNKNGTFFSKSEFVKAVTTKNSIILLDELNRASDDALNILFSILDYNQRYLRLNDEVDSPRILVADGVSFIATANIGRLYTGTRSLDIALEDRFTTKIEMDELTAAQRRDILLSMFPSLSEEVATTISLIAEKVNSKVNGEITDAIILNQPISTRTCIAVAELIVDGFSLKDALEHTVYPMYPDGGNDSERVFVKQIVQGYLKN